MDGSFFGEPARLLRSRAQIPKATKMDANTLIDTRFEKKGREQNSHLHCRLGVFPIGPELNDA